jgi:hypothetical protein
MTTAEAVVKVSENLTVLGIGLAFMYLMFRAFKDDIL